MPDFLSWIKPKRHLLGLDIGSRSIKVVQLSSTRRGVALQYAGLNELPQAEGGDGAPSASMAVQEIFQTRRFRGQKIAIPFTGSAPIIRYLLLPPMPKHELGEAVRWEAKKVVPWPIEKGVLDYLIMGETEERNLKRIEVLLVVAERTAVMELLQSFERILVPIAAMDVNPLALFNAVRHNHRPDLDDNLVFVDIGAGKMDINISKHGALRFTRNVQIGGEGMTQSLMRGLQIERGEAEQMARQRGLAQISAPTEQDGRIHEILKEEADRIILETQRSVDYYRAQFRESAIRKIFLMGGVSMMPGFQEYFARYFDAPVEMDNPFGEIACDTAVFEDLHLTAPRFTAAVGLALRRSGE